MEHIVQFAVSVDDDRIQKIMEESAAKQVMDEIEKFANGTGYNGKPLRSDAKYLKEMFEEQIMTYIKEHADEIVPLAVAEVSKRMLKTKKVKEAIDDIVEG